MDNELDLHITDDLIIGGGAMPASGRRLMGDKNFGMSFPVFYGEHGFHSFLKIVVCPL